VTVVMAPYQYSHGQHGSPTLGLSGVAALTGWPSPKARDFRAPGTYASFIRRKRRARPGSRGATDLNVLATTIPGPPSPSSGATSEPPAGGGFLAVLAIHCRWLMGFPPVLDASAPMATRSSRKPLRRSSARSSP